MIAVEPRISLARIAALFDDGFNRPWVYAAARRASKDGRWVDLRDGELTVDEVAEWRSVGLITGAQAQMARRWRRERA